MHGKAIRVETGRGTFTARYGTYKMGSGEHNLPMVVYHESVQNVAIARQFIKGRYLLKISVDGGEPVTVKSGVVVWRERGTRPIVFDVGWDSSIAEDEEQLRQFVETIVDMAFIRADDGSEPTSL